MTAIETLPAAPESSLPAPAMPPDPLATARAALAVAWAELRLTTRTAAFWVVLVVMTWFPLAAVLLLGQQATAQGALGTAIFWAEALLPLLFARAFVRDRLRRMTPLVRARPITPATYALGKWLAIVGLGAALLLWMILVPYVTIWLTTGTPPDALSWALILPPLGVAVLVVAGVAALGLRLVPRGVLGALAASAALITFTELMGNFTLLNPTNLALGSLYYQPTVGFGPDTPLLLAQDFVHLAFAALCVALLALAANLGAWRGVTRTGWLASAGGVVVAGLLLTASLAGFSAASGSVQAAGMAPANPIAATVSAYTLDMTLDPRSGALSGTATFTLTPDFGGAVPTLNVLLNPGLRVTAARAGGAAVPYTTTQGWTTLHLGGLGVGGGLTIALGYRGSLAVPRDDYASVQSGYALFSTGPQGVQMLTSSGASSGPGDIADYAGQGFAFLEAGGDWYPRPWVTATVDRMRRGADFASVRVRLPAGVTVLSPLGPTASGGDWQTISAQPDGPLPVAFLAAFDHAERLTLGGASVYARGGMPAANYAGAYADEMDAIQRVSAALDPAAPGWTGVVVPLISAPAVGPGLIFLPDLETRGLVAPGGLPAVLQAAPDSLNTIPAATLPGRSVGLPVTSDAGDYHYLAQAVAQAWWRDAALFAAPPGVPDNERCQNVAPNFTPQAPAGRLLCNWPDDGLADILAEYCAGTVTAQVFGAGWLPREIAARQAFHAALVQDAANPPGPPAPGSAYMPNPIAHAMVMMQALGLLPMADQDFTQNVLAWYGLADQIGPDGMTAILRSFAAAHAARPATIADFAAAVPADQRTAFQARLAQLQIPDRPARVVSQHDGNPDLERSGHGRQAHNSAIARGVAGARWFHATASDTKAACAAWDESACVQPNCAIFRPATAHHRSSR